MCSCFSNCWLHALRNYGLGDNDFGSFHFRCAGSATDCEDEKPTVTSVYFAGNYDGDRTCRRRPAPPWSSHDEDSVAVQAAVHAIFGMPLGGSAFQGKCLAVPGRDETAWLQVRTRVVVQKHGVSVD